MLDRLVAKLRQREGGKLMWKYIDVASGVDWLCQHEHSYIVADTYLVVYDIGSPWYAKGTTLFLAELLVLRLANRGAEPFRVVPAFLERKAREAGCVLTVVGTALAPADAALASLYNRAGFNTACITLAKEP